MSNRSRDWEEIEEQPVSRFSCELQSRQCEYIIRTDGRRRRRCKLRTRRALPYCWQHAQIVDHVILRKSRVARGGMGLFAFTSSIPRYIPSLNLNSSVYRINGISSSSWPDRICWGSRITSKGSSAGKDFIASLCPKSKRVVPLYPVEGLL